jgi:hypothetical protein
MKKVLFYFLVIIAFIAGIGADLRAERVSKAQRLSREDVRRFLDVYLQRENPFNWSKKKSQYGLFQGIGFQILVMDRLKELDAKDSVIIKTPDDPFVSQGFQKEIRPAYGLQFSNKPSPFLLGPSRGLTDKVYIELNKIQNFDIVDFKKIAVNEYKADLFVGFKLTPFGDILLGRGIMVQRKDGAFFETYDEGWRVKLKIQF